MNYQAVLFVIWLWFIFTISFSAYFIGYGLGCLFAILYDKLMVK